jgi:hypothetical protein
MTSPRRPNQDIKTADAVDDVDKTEVVQRKPVASKSKRTVTVACKIPQGIILQLQRPAERMEDTRDGPRPRTYWVKFGEIFFVRGPAYPVGTIPKGFRRPPINEGGYALTNGIPADFWEQWAEQNAKADFVVAPDGAEHGMIFAYPDMEDAASAAREQEKLLSGLEPISTDEDDKGKLIDPRLPRPENAGLGRLAHEPHPNQG